MSSNNPEQWRDKLSAEQFHVCWEKGTERPYSGALLHNRKSGDYHCVCCKQVLFHSDAKFDAGCGWPSFDRAIEGTVTYTEDNSHGMKRVEITCPSAALTSVTSSPMDRPRPASATASTA